MPTQTCVLCRTYQPDNPPRAATHGQACDTCLHQLDKDLHAVGAMHERALQPDVALADTRRHTDGSVHDRLAQQLPMAAVNPRSTQPQVTGSRERTIPINVRLHDLTAPARPVITIHEFDEDQVGDLSVGTVLMSWAEHWAGTVFGEYLPPRSRTVAVLVGWLRGPRIDQIAAVAPDVAQFAYQLRHLRRALLAALGEAAPRPMVMWGIPCRRCNAVSTLIVDTDDPERYRECTGCGVLLTEDEYKTWLLQLVDALRKDDKSNVAES